LICGAVVLLSLLLAGHGGEGRKRSSMAVVRSSSCRGFSSVSARRRGAGRSSTGNSGVLPWRKTVEIVLEADPLNKCYHLLHGSLAAVPFLLAGRGGEEEKGDGLQTTASRRWTGEFLESALPAAVSQRRLRLDVATFGQKAGPAALDSGCYSSMFFLLQRIIYSLDADLQALAQPSGFVPGVSRSVGVGRLFIVGVLQGLDCFLAIFFRVCFVIFQDFAAFSLVREVLSVVVHPPPK
jgi:hypothetical protein